MDNKERALKLCDLMYTIRSRSHAEHIETGLLEAEQRGMERAADIVEATENEYLKAAMVVLAAKIRRAAIRRKIEET